MSSDNDSRQRTGITALCILTGTLAFALISQAVATSLQIRALEEEVAYRQLVADKVAEQCVKMCIPTNEDGELQ